MIARASRVFPGVLVTMLLGGPFLAAPALANTAPTNAPPGTHRTQTHKATAQKNAPRRTLIAHTRLKPQKHTVTASVAFIDDGAGYRETPSGEAVWRQSGVASWYGGSRWQGHRTSSGSVYNENDLTAAHATLPLGTHVKVALHNSSRSVVVTITDRPGTRTRIIDLSRGAAAALGILDQGVAMVTLALQ